MYSRLLVLTSLLLSTTAAFAQNVRVAGTVRNDKNEPLAGVSIKGTQGGTSSNTDGSFILTLSKGTKHSIHFTAVGYAPRTVEGFDPAGGSDLNVVLETASQSLTGVTVTGARAPRRETVNALIAYQKNTGTVAQVISAETIRRSPDKNTGEVLRRVPGTSILEGKYLVVRGLADRYNQTMLNGVLLSSTEPDRKTFSYDIFPATMLDNMIINKAFIPELPGEWAGGLVQINTRDIPANGFLTVQAGTGFNTQTIGRDFYSYKGGRLDFLGVDDGFRAIPTALPTKSALAAAPSGEQAAFGRRFANIWTAEKIALLPNHSAQVAGGFNTRLLGKRLGGSIALTYNRSFRRVPFSNRFIANEAGDVNFTYESARYSQDVLAGALAYVTERTGEDFLLGSGYGQKLAATELALRQNVFFNTQLQGDHAFGNANGLKLRWWGGFNILDQYIPDQRRMQYVEETPGGAWLALLGGGNSQKSGSRFFSMLSDYNYTAGGDLSKTFDAFGQKQTVKAGYLLQMKDRLFDARPFFYGISDGTRNPNTLLALPAGAIFAPERVTGLAEAISFGELQSPNYRYLANTILNAGFLQFDNAFSDKLRAVWGVRYEDFDQVVGTMKASDPRHVRSVVGDWLPGLNLTYKLNGRTNIRLSGSQTVIRPEFRELSNFAFYDFELGATVLGNSKLQRTKVSNADLRWELYPRAGELFTVGVFYKYFRNPIETYFNNLGAGSSATFNFANMEKAESYGVELEARKKLDFVSGLRNFTLTSNLSYIYNRVKGVNVNRPMQGQSPYLVNLGLQYDLEQAGFSSTLLFNRIGRRILYVGNLNQSVGASGIPDIWEHPRSLLDLQVAKKVLRGKGELRLSVSDVLNQPAIFYHNLDKNKQFNAGADVPAIRRSYGSNVSVTFNYAIR
ncbi:MAG: TonB-dependent receptor [Chitinophagaceae bacterium]|nr:MAG: TonB-dependent receptor [Chitinophagaceae bacterium]